MSDNTVVELGHARLLVPIVENEETTRKIAQRVTDRLKGIEGTSERLDTYAFALRAAFEFAAELHAVQEERGEDQRDMTRCLDRILTRITEMTRDFGPEKNPEPKEPASPTTPFRRA